MGIRSHRDALSPCEIFQFPNLGDRLRLHLSVPLPLAFTGLLLSCLHFAQPTSISLEMGGPLPLSVQLDQF